MSANPNKTASPFGPGFPPVQTRLPGGSMLSLQSSQPHPVLSTPGTANNHHGRGLGLTDPVLFNYKEEDLMADATSALGMNMLAGCDGVYNRSEVRCAIGNVLFNNHFNSRTENKIINSLLMASTPLLISCAPSGPLNEKVLTRLKRMLIGNIGASVSDSSPWRSLEFLFFGTENQRSEEETRKVLLSNQWIRLVIQLAIKTKEPDTINFNCSCKRKREAEKEGSKGELNIEEEGGEEEDEEPSTKRSRKE